jgi:hypothetical protein
MQNQRLLWLKAYYHIAHSWRYLHYIPDLQILQLRDYSFSGTAFIIHTTSNAHQAMQKIVTIPTCTLVPNLYQPGPDLRTQGLDSDCLRVPTLGIRHQIVAWQRTSNLSTGCSSS